ncbi:peptidase U32 [Denitrovibrio acetiphilus DSM 12809]|uniref:Peptidase U32 n=1 Tax=Denitrovibrio acetiphilus (strain DSM 12809 / NBRC 114555 / N2460) TaxID=522772 RepID=D4H346_DENA2|nr:peptidase U32 family protein [Denitrovibrio acetiphilus]ADD69069.1 peptidase U32 [Denitrovibrio acetiphilus DSM 12809]
MNKPELLSPAGSFEKLKAAVRFGADAVYLAGAGYGLRVRASNFELPEMEEAFRYLHERGRKGYVTVNAFLKNRELDGVRKYIGELKDIRPDALIISDPGVFRIAREVAPEIPVHISTQANVTNLSAVEFWHELGAERVILAREVTGDETAFICKSTPCEVEVFVHGAMCISMSGRCLISNYMTGRDANAGDCAQSCRWKYALVEESRDGQYFPVAEDDRGTYFYNSKDLCLLPRVNDLAGVGVKSLKIEGRMKSVMYVSTVTGVYRQAIDAAAEGDYSVKDEWIKLLTSVSHREYTEASYSGQAYSSSMNYGTSSYVRGCDFLAIVEGDAEGGVFIDAKAKFGKGEKVMLLTPDMKETEIEAGSIIALNGIEEINTKPGMKYILRGLSAPEGSLIRRYA